MDEEKELKEIMKCEVCKGEEGTELVNVGLELAYHLGDYGNDRPEEVKVKPIFVSVCSIYLCRDCKSTFERRKNNPSFYEVSKDILP